MVLLHLHVHPPETVEIVVQSQPQSTRESEVEPPVHRTRVGRGPSPLRRRELGLADATNPPRYREVPTLQALYIGYLAFLQEWGQSQGPMWLRPNDEAG